MKIKYLPLLLICSTSFAYTLLPSGVLIEVQYDEPTTFSDGTPLTNLQKTTIFYNMGQGSTTIKDVNASNLRGGGHIVTEVSIPILPSQEKTLTVWATATSTKGVTSIRSNVESLNVDRLSPGTGSTSANVSGTEFLVSYKEPTRKSNGDLLNDLLKTVILYNAGQGEIVVKEVLATSLNGGGQVNEKVLVPITEGTESTVIIYWIAYDLSLNPSAPSLPVTKVLDRLSPAPPQ